MHFFLHLASAACFIQASAAQLPPVPSLKPIPSYRGCPPDGPLLPRPTNLAQSKHFKDAAHGLTAAIDSALNGEIRAGWPVDNVSFSIGLVSPNDQQGARPIWEYHHRAALNTQGTDTVTGDSQYLIGSVSKVFSDLMLLKSGVDIHTPVTHFFPELAALESMIPWEEITLETLGEHLAGIPPNCTSVYSLLFSFSTSVKGSQARRLRVLLSPAFLRKSRAATPRPIRLSPLRRRRAEQHQGLYATGYVLSRL